MAREITRLSSLGATKLSHILSPHCTRSPRLDASLHGPRCGGAQLHESDGTNCVHGTGRCRRVRPVPAAQPRCRLRRCRGGSSRSPAVWATASSGTCCSRRCRCCTARPRCAPAVVMAAHRRARACCIYALLKRLFVRERPFITHAGIDRAGAPLDRYSFPSGHTLHAVSFTWQAGAHFPELLWVLLPLAALIAASRVVLGLHYPSDVLAGAAIGAALAELGLSLAKRAHAATAACARRAPAPSACASCSSRTSTSRASTASRLPSAPSAHDLAQLGVRHAARRPALRGTRSGRGARHHAHRRRARAGGSGGPAHALGRADAARWISCRRGEFDLVHIHTPFIAHYAGVRFARARAHPVRRDLPHLLRGIPAPLRAGAAARPGPLSPRGTSRARSARRCRRSSPRPSRCARCSPTTACARRSTCVPTGLAADRFRAGDGARLPRRAPASRPPVRW